VERTSEWGDPKSEAGERTISLDSHTVAVLRAHRRAQTEARLAWGAAWVDSGLVFTKEDGSALNPDTVSQRFERLVARSGLPPIRLHDLRHVAASLALAAGVPMKVVSEQLGHSSIQITSDIYSSVLPQVAQAAAQAVADLVPRAAPAGPTSGTSATSGPRRAHRGTIPTPERVAARTKPQVNEGGAGGARTRDRGIMSRTSAGRYRVCRVTSICRVRDGDPSGAAAIGRLPPRATRFVRSLVRSARPSGMRRFSPASCGAVPDAWRAGREERFTVGVLRVDEGRHQSRVSSPRPGCFHLMTWAPRSPGDGRRTHCLKSAPEHAVAVEDSYTHHRGRDPTRRRLWGRTSPTRPAVHRRRQARGRNVNFRPR
jgi:hypothetical protein